MWLNIQTAPGTVQTSSSLSFFNQHWVNTTFIGNLHSTHSLERRERERWDVIKSLQLLWFSTTPFHGEENVTEWKSHSFCVSHRPPPPSIDSGSGQSSARYQQPKNISDFFRLGQQTKVLSHHPLFMELKAENLVIFAICDDNHIIMIG